MTTLRIAAIFVVTLLWSCSPRTTTTTNRAAIDAILTAHGLPKAPEGSQSLSAATIRHHEFDKVKIQFVCTPIECAHFISQVPGAPAHDNQPALDELVRYLESAPTGQVLRDRKASDEPHHSYIVAERQTDGTLSVTIELEDIHHPN